MIDTILTIVLGSVAGVAAFLSCVAIWRINPAFDFLNSENEEECGSNHPAGSEDCDLSEGAMLRLSVNIMQQELALTKDGATVTGSYINIEQNRDGMQTCNKIFLN
jgi:hypothetical protein